MKEGIKKEINTWLIWLLIGLPILIIADVLINKFIMDPKPWVFFVVGIPIGALSMILAIKIVKK